MSGAPSFNTDSNGCDLVKLLAATGSTCRVLRIWRGGEPYFARSQVATTLTTATDKRLRAATAKALTEEDEVNKITDLSALFGPAAQV
jgi:hypothetical protein